MLPQSILPSDTLIGRWVRNMIKEQFSATSVLAPLVAITLGYKVIQFLNDGNLAVRFKVAAFHVWCHVQPSTTQALIDDASRIHNFDAKLTAPADVVIDNEQCPPATVATILQAERIRVPLDVDPPFADPRAGKTSGSLYSTDATRWGVLENATTTFLPTNPLHAVAFPTLCVLESRLIDGFLRLFEGDAAASAPTKRERPQCGVLTNGSTAAIHAAVYCSVAWGRTRGIRRPSIVAPETIHPALDKACREMGVMLIRVPVDKATHAVDVRAMQNHLRYDTVAMFASAPSFPTGLVDPIPELAMVAFTEHVHLHVDACLALVVARELVDEIGFASNPGVTTIITDSSKHAGGPKGVGILLYANKELRSHQVFTKADWSGGLYGTPGACGSCSGALIAAHWALVKHVGFDQLMKEGQAIKQLRGNMETIADRLGFTIVGGRARKCTVLSVTHSDQALMKLVDEHMHKRGWCFSSLRGPPGLQFIVTTVHVNKTGFCEEFEQDLRDSKIEAVRRLQEAQRQDNNKTTRQQHTKFPERYFKHLIVEYGLRKPYETYYDL